MLCSDWREGGLGFTMLQEDWTSSVHWQSELRNINQKLNGWLLAEQEPVQRAVLGSIWEQVNSQRTQNRAEETNSPRSNQHRPQKVVTTSHRLMYSSLPIYTASSEFSWLWQTTSLGALPNRCIYPSNALKGHLISTIAPAPGQDPEARIFLNYACWESSHMITPERRRLQLWFHLSELEVYASSPIVWQLQRSFTVSVNKEKGHKAADYKCAERRRWKELHLDHKNPLNQWQQESSKSLPLQKMNHLTLLHNL